MAADRGFLRVVCMAWDVGPRAGDFELAAVSLLERILAAEPEATVACFGEACARVEALGRDRFQRTIARVDERSEDLDSKPSPSLQRWFREVAPKCPGLPVVLVPTEELVALTAAVLGLESDALELVGGSLVAFDWPLESEASDLEPRCASLGTLDWPPQATGGRAGFPSGPAATEPTESA